MGGQFLWDAVGDLRPVGEFGVADPAVRRRGVFRFAGGHGQHAFGRCCAGVFGVGRHHFGLCRQHDFVAGVVVHVPVILRADDDRVAFLQFVDVAERLPVAVAVAGEGEVADLAGHLRIRVVAEAVLVELCQVRAFHQVALPLAAESRYVDLGDEFAFRGALRLYRRVTLLCLRHGDVAGLSWIRPGYGLAGFDLVMLRLHARPPHLPCDVQRADGGGGQHEFGEDAEYRPQRAFGASATACHMFHRLLFPLLRVAVLVVFERFRILQRLLQRVGRVEMQFRFLVDLPS